MCFADHLDTMDHHLFRYSILFLEWSKGGILTPSSMMRGGKEGSDEAFLERSKKRSLLLKKWRVPNPVLHSFLVRGCCFFFLAGGGSMNPSAMAAASGAGHLVLLSPSLLRK